MSDSNDELFEVTLIDKEKSKHKNAFSILNIKKL